MSAAPVRCSAVSRACAEPLAGTASTYRGWVLLEQPGPWGAVALRHSRLPAGLGAELARLAPTYGVRVLLVRRPGRAPSAGRRHCFLGHTGPTGCWFEHVRLDDPRDLLGLDLSGLGAGRRPGLEPVESPLFLVCTHGRHDPCCAERGRPVARALAARFPAETWESSHLGGDRFAANIVCFPAGVYYGQVEAGEAVRLAEDYWHGRLDLERYRGRSAHPFAVQAGEAHLRRTLGLGGVHDLELTAVRRSAAGTEASFALAGGGAVVVTVSTVPAEQPRPLTCHAVEAARPPTFAVTAPSPRQST